MARMKKFAWLRWIVLAGLALAIVLIPFPASTAAPKERTFLLQASRSGYTPSVLMINPGDKVTIELAATDVVHGISIDGYNIETTADPGQPARLTFVADKQGSFHFRCTVTCGNLHPFMIGKLNVGTNTLLWRAVALAVLALVGGVWAVKK